MSILFNIRFYNAAARTWWSSGARTRANVGVYSSLVSRYLDSCATHLCTIWTRIHQRSSDSQQQRSTQSTVMDLETQQRVRAIIKRLQSDVEESYNNFLLTHGHRTEDRGQSVTNYQSTESNICLSTVTEILFLVSRVSVTRDVSRSITAANTVSLVPVLGFLHLVIRKLDREFEFLKVQQPIVVNIKFQQIFL